MERITKKSSRRVLRIMAEIELGDLKRNIIKQNIVFAERALASLLTVYRAMKHLELITDADYNQKISEAINVKVYGKKSRYWEVI